MDDFTRQLTHLTPPYGIDFPTVGATLAAWTDPTVGVGAYSLTSKQSVQLHPSGGGSAFTAGHVLLYVVSTRPSDPEHGKWALIVDRLR